MSYDMKNLVYDLSKCCAAKLDEFFNLKTKSEMAIKLTRHRKSKLKFYLRLSRSG